jgi:hypothetical protein
LVEQCGFVVHTGAIYPPSPQNLKNCKEASTYSTLCALSAQTGP